MNDPYFDRFDIVEAHYLIEVHYNVSGVLQERASNQRRRMSTEYQLSRMGFKKLWQNDYNDLSENGRAIYHHLEKRYGFTE